MPQTVFFNARRKASPSKTSLFASLNKLLAKDGTDSPEPSFASFSRNSREYAFPFNSLYSKRTAYCCDDPTVDAHIKKICSILPSLTSPDRILLQVSLAQATYDCVDPWFTSSMICENKSSIDMFVSSLIMNTNSIVKIANRIVRPKWSEYRRVIWTVPCVSTVRVMRIGFKVIFKVILLTSHRFFFFTFLHQFFRLFCLLH